VLCHEKGNEKKNETGVSICVHAIHQSSYRPPKSKRIEGIACADAVGSFSPSSREGDFLKPRVGFSLLLHSSEVYFFF
jgi:hypothetical protein